MNIGQSILGQVKTQSLKPNYNRYLDDKSDKTDIWDKNWDEIQTELGDAIGGNYLGVHLRRKDFLYARKEEVPSLSDAISQIKDRFLEKHSRSHHSQSKL